MIPASAPLRGSCNAYGSKTMDATAFSSQKVAGDTDRAFGSILSAEAARAGKNFLTPAIQSPRNAGILMREEDAAIDESGCWQRVSSIVCFNCSHRSHSISISRLPCSAASSEFVHTVEQVIFEHSPGRP